MGRIAGEHSWHVYDAQGAGYLLALALTLGFCSADAGGGHVQDPHALRKILTERYRGFPVD